MADSPAKSLGSGVVTLMVSVDGKQIPDVMVVSEVEVVKEVNKIPYARITLLDGDPREQTFPQSEESVFEPGKELEVKVKHDPTGQDNSIYKGIIIEHGIRLTRFGGSMLVVMCRDAAYGLTVGRQNKIFAEKKDSDIISEVIKDSGVKSTADVEATKCKHEKIIQYYSTNWDFIQSRADANGLVTIINDGKISIKKPTVSEKTDIVVNYGLDLIDLDIKMDATHQYTEVQSNFWEYTKQEIDNTSGKKPTVNKQGNLDSGKLGKAIKPKELVHISGHVSKEATQAWADAVYQRGHLSRIRGRAKFVGSEKIEVGKTIELASLGARFNGDAYIGKITHSVKDGQWFTEVGLGISPLSHLETYPSATPLPAGGSIPGIFGLHHGVVTKIHGDPKGQYRVMVQIPIVDGKKGEGVWARMSQTYSTEDCGMVFFPEIGDEVILGFIDGDPTYPVILGSLYSNKQAITTEATHDPAEKNIFKAMSFNKGKMRIEFADDPGKNNLKLITEDKMVVSLNDDEDSITIEDPVNKNKLVMDPKGTTLTVDKDLTIDVKGEIKMTGKKNIAMKATQDIKGEGMNVQFKGKVAFKAEGAQFEIKGSGMGKVDGGGMLTLKGGMVMIN